MSTITLAAVGDIALVRQVAECIHREGAAAPFARVTPTLADADIRFGSLESVITDPAFPPDQISRNALAAGDFVWPALREAGFHVLNLAANHALDCGSRGLLNTIDRARQTGARTIGVGRNADEAHAMAVVERHGLRIGCVGFLEPCNGTLEGGAGRIAYFRIDDAVERIRALCNEVDALVVSLHADLEFTAAPSLPRVAWCRRLIDAGATVVLCHHPHVPQGVERRGTGLIAYSLGNFVFGIGDYQRNASPDVYRATILKIELEPHRVVAWRREHARIQDDGRTRLLDGADAREAEEHALALDAILTDPERLRALWHETALRHMRIWWKRAEADGADRFIEKYAWRILCNSESNHWVSAILDMARATYERNARFDFETRRPNAPFED